MGSYKNEDIKSNNQSEVKIIHIIVQNNTYYSTLLEKYPTFFLFCENLVDFNEAHLHEVTLNPHMHT